MAGPTDLRPLNGLHNFRSTLKAAVGIYRLWLGIHYKYQTRLLCLHVCGTRSPGGWDKGPWKTESFASQRSFQVGLGLMGRPSCSVTAKTVSGKIGIGTGTTPPLPGPRLKSQNTGLRSVQRLAGQGLSSY